MREGQIISWIFLAVAIASQEKPSDIKGISMIADGINHAIPTQRELNLSLPYLIEKKLIAKEGAKYKLTKAGMIHYGFASLKTKAILNIWKNLERQIIK